MFATPPLQDAVFLKDFLPQLKMCVSKVEEYLADYILAEVNHLPLPPTVLQEVKCSFDYFPRVCMGIVVLTLLPG